MRLRAQLAIALLGASSVVLGASTASCDPSPGEASLPADRDVAEARSLFVEGAHLAKVGRWDDALHSFERSNEKRRHAITTYNIAFCERALGHYTRARRAYAQSLAEDVASGGKELSDALRDGARAAREDVEAHVVHAAITIEGRGVYLAVDGRPLELVSSSPPQFVAGTLPPGPGTPSSERFELLVDPGVHLFVLTDSEGEQTLRTETIAAAAKVTLTLGPKSRVTRAPPAIARAASDGGRRAQRVAGAAMAAAGLAAAGVGAGFAASAAVAWSDAKKACPDERACPNGDGQARSIDARGRANIATVAFVGAGAALSGAALLWFTAAPPRSERAATAFVRVGVASLAVEVQR